MLEAGEALGPFFGNRCIELAYGCAFLKFTGKRVRDNTDITDITDITRALGCWLPRIGSIVSNVMEEIIEGAHAYFSRNLGFTG